MPTCSTPFTLIGDDNSTKEAWPHARSRRLEVRSGSWRDAVSLHGGPWCGVECRPQSHLPRVGAVDRIWRDWPGTIFHNFGLRDPHDGVGPTRSLLHRISYQSDFSRVLGSCFTHGSFAVGGVAER